MKTADGGTAGPGAVTKQGEIFLLDRETGDADRPVEERPVPQGEVPGDRNSPTQPFSAWTCCPPATDRECDMWGATPVRPVDVPHPVQGMRYEGLYTPPSVQGSLIYPGNFGVFDWGGVSVDPVRQMLFASPNYMAFDSKMVPRAEVAADRQAQERNRRRATEHRRALRGDHATRSCRRWACRARRRPGVTWRRST